MSDSNNPISSALNHLPQDLIEAILPFLPPKSLGRFKSVSKRWCSLISSPEFIKIHIRNYTINNPNPNPTHLILVPEYSDYPHYSLDMKQINTQITPATATAKPLKYLTTHKIYGSCNGLLLGKDRDNLCLVNPTTRKTLNVPDPGGENSFETYVFGYDLSTDDYNVISIFYMDSAPDSVFARVYSLRNNSWNNFSNIPYEKCDFYGPWIFLNSNFHWLFRSKRRIMTIGAFSLGGEQFHEIEFPDSINYDGAECCQLCVLGGKLAVVIMCDDIEYELWVMEEYGVRKSWTKLCIIESVISPYFGVFTQVRGSNQDSLLGISHDAEFYLYNMDERRFTSVTIEGRPEGFMISGMFVESLESFERFR